MALSSDEEKRLTASLGQLLSPEALWDPDAWRLTAVQVLRHLVSADCACAAIESDIPTFSGVHIDARIVKAYAEHYVRVDLGIARQRARALELWSRDTLWCDAELAHSEYYNDFALPHRLLDAVGVAYFAQHRCLRISLLYAARPAPALTRHRLRLLACALPAFRSGAALSLRLRQWHDTMSGIIDRVTQPLALCSTTGRVLHQNPALVRVMTGDDRARLANAITRVSTAVAATGTRARLCDSIASDTSVSHGRWHIVGSRVDWELGGKAPAILVSLLPRAESSNEEVSARCGLTCRELEVIRLLRQRLSNTEIARALGISAHTARHHTESVLFKLGLHSRRQVDEYFATGARH